jgi:hypothetical protein
MKYVVWDEPVYSEVTGELLNRQIRMTESDAIFWQKEHAFKMTGYVYTSDGDALEDFATLHWGRIVDE